MAATAAQNDWVSRVLGLAMVVPNPVPETPVVDGEDGGETPDPYYLAERLQDGRQQLHPLSRANDPAAAELTRLLAAATQAIESGSPGAPAAMDAYEEALASASSAMRAREVTTASRVPLAFRKLLIEWHAAQAAVQQDIKAMGDAYLDHPEVQADPRYDAMFEAVSKFPALIPSFGDQLDTDINALLNDGGQSKGPIEAGLQTIAEYRKTLSGAAVLTELETAAANDLGESFGLVSTLTTVIDRIEAQMKMLSAA